MIASKSLSPQRLSYVLNRTSLLSTGGLLRHSVPLSASSPLRASPLSVLGSHSPTSRGFCKLSAPNRGPYLEEFLINGEMICGLLPPSFWNWFYVYCVAIVGSYIAFMFHYNYYYYGTIWIRTHTGLVLTEDSW